MFLFGFVLEGPAAIISRTCFQKLSSKRAKCPEITSYFRKTKQNLLQYDTSCNLKTKLILNTCSGEMFCHVVTRSNACHYVTVASCYTKSQTITGAVKAKSVAYL